MTLATDLRYALRRLVQAPGFSLAVVTMLALGIALSAAMIGVLRGVLGSLPFPQAEQVVVIEGHSPERGVENGGITPAEARQLAESDSPFAHVGYYDWNGITVLDGERPREITVIRVSDGFFPALGMPPLLGRWFNADDYASADAVVLAHGEWQRLFGGDPAALGKVIDTTAGRLRVVGVMPSGFAVPSEDAGGWVALPPAAYPLDQPWTVHARFVGAVARLDPDLGAAALQQRLDRASATLAERHSLPAGQWQLRVRPLLEVLVGELRGVLWSALAVAVLVLLIACANVAILIDARQVARRHAQAVVQALGASRRRLYGGLLLEIGLLTAFAVLIGIGLAVFGVDALRELARSSLPRVEAIAIDAGVLAVAALLGLLVPLVAAAAGALRPRGEAVDAMRSGGKGVVGGRTRRDWLPVLGVALSTVSLIAGSALVFSLWRLQSVDPGHHHDNVYVMQLFHENADMAARGEFARRLQAQLAALPAVEQVVVSSWSPMSAMGRMHIDLQRADRSEPEPYQLGLRRVSADFADALGIRRLAGRGFGVDDQRGGERVAIVNRDLAERLGGVEAALDQMVALPLGNGPRVAYRIVGVVEDTRNRGLRSAPGPELWLPFEAEPPVGMSFLVRSTLPLPAYATLFADALHAVDPREAATLSFPLSERVDDQLASARFFARTVGAFALAALLLAAFGVYAVAALRQQQRVAEFGLRLAIGARPQALVAQMLGDSARAVAIGVGLGLVGAWLALRALQAQLYGLDGAQASVVVSGVGLLLGTALVAALVPALRVARIDPMRALRHD